MLILSLLIGLTAYQFISLKVVYHNSFDTCFPKYKNIYRIVSSAYTDNTLTISQPRTQRILGKTMEEIYPEVTRSGYVCGAIQNHYRIGDDSFTNDLGFHCSTGFVEIFSIEIRQGSSAQLLMKPNTVIISESFSHKHFGDKNPLGETLHQYPANQFEIVAVYRDFPENSHFKPDFLISFHDNMHLPPPLKEDWGEFSFYTYLELKENSDLEKLEKGIAQLCSENNQALIKESNTSYSFGLQALRDIHTGSQLKNELSQNVRGDYLRILQLISIFILVISGFNYVYFSFASISRNSVQFGIRKMFGASNASLLSKFMVDSLIIHSIALILSVGAIELLQKVSMDVNGLVPYRILPFRFWINLLFVFLASSLITPTILILMLGKKSPLGLLTQKLENHHRNFSFRLLFTVLQFIIIISLLATILGINKQVNYLKKMDTGLNMEDKLVIKTPANMRRTSNRIINLDAFEQELAKISGVQSISISNVVPGDIPVFAFNASEQLDMHGIKTALFIADNNFLNSYEIEILAGEDFSNRRDSVCIINTICLHQLGYKGPGDVLGKKLYLQDESAMQTIEAEIIGVCEGFNFTNVKEGQDPVVLLDWTKNIMWENYSLSISPNTDENYLLARVEALFNQTFPNYPLEYVWLMDYYNKQFEDENSVIRNLKSFVIVAVLLAVLSLLSMARQMSLARTKEIGIRKVNGALRLDIVQLLNLYYLKWIGISSIIAIPLSWYYLTTWLKSFAYRTNISIWIFLIASGSAFFIGMITVTLQSLKVANMNPADSLKYE